MSAFSNAVASSFGTLQRVAGEAITYHRGGASVALTAVPGSTQLTVEVPNERMTQQVRSADWICSVADLGDLFPPRKGDVVKRLVGDARQVYELMTPPFRPCDHTGSRVRLITRRTSTEAA